MRRAFAVVLSALAAGGCTSLRDQSVPGCPYCGDPVTRVSADGLNEVVPRPRLATWGAAALPAPTAAGETATRRQ